LCIVSYRSVGLETVHCRNPMTFSGMNWMIVSQNRGDSRRDCEFTCRVREWSARLTASDALAGLQTCNCINGSRVFTTPRSALLNNQSGHDCLTTLNGGESDWSWLVGRRPRGKAALLLTNNFQGIPEHSMFCGICPDLTQFISSNIPEMAQCYCGFQSHSIYDLRFP
jgi:hypothetical protein